MVKEQKGRLEEINKSKQEMQIGFKVKIDSIFNVPFSIQIVFR